MDRKIRVAAIGDNCIDYYDSLNESYPGGNPVGVDAHGAANSASALRGQVQRRDRADHGCEAADREDPRQPHPRQAGREAPGGGQDCREEAAFSPRGPVKTASGRSRIFT